MEADPVAVIFERHGISGPWEPLRPTGIANRVYATRDVVLRIATDDPEAVEDARTESVAAPVAHAAGVLTPQLLAFDDSRELVNRPYSLWERVAGETFGLLHSDPCAMPDTWRAVGRQLAQLHGRVGCCPDPDGYLDRPRREMDLEGLLGRLVDAGRVDEAMAKAVHQLVRDLRPDVEGPAGRCFLHNDLHAMNIMCTVDGRLLALIDWGDAGWGDPTLEFAMMPLAAVPFVIEGYESEAPGGLGSAAEARIVWDQLHGAMERVREGAQAPLPLDPLRRFLHSGLT